MFSGFRFRNRNADPAQAVGEKRPNENDNSPYDEFGEPPEKTRRFEFDDSDDESSVCLPSDLENFVRKYIRKHVGDKAIKERMLTDNPVNLITQPKRQGAKSHYELVWRKFCSWCSGKNIDPFGCSLA